MILSLSYMKLIILNFHFQFLTFLSDSSMPNFCFSKTFVLNYLQYFTKINFLQTLVLVIITVNHLRHILLVFLRIFKI